MKLYEVLDRDPRTARLANNGQARITNQTDEKATLELRAELETFVCEGQFGHAIQIILERYLGNLGHTKQDSAWVSGFLHFSITSRYFSMRISRLHEITSPRFRKIKFRRY